MDSFQIYFNKPKIRANHGRVVVEIMKKLSSDEIEYQKYLAREKYLLDEISKKKYAEYRMNKKT
jgi:ribonucleotide reductase beta subunit family protein with ferritin-like domain